MAPCRFTVKVRCGDIDGVSCAQELSIGADIGMITSIIRAVERVTMQTVMQQITRHTCHAPKWLRQAGAMGFFYFLLKGLAWLTAAAKQEQKPKQANKTNTQTTRNSARRSWPQPAPSSANARR